MKLKGTIVAGLLIAALPGCAMAAPKTDAADKNRVEKIPTVSEVDFERFEGKWFELARIPIPVARDWVNTCDRYIHNADGSWTVRYEGNKGNDSGPRKVLKQTLRITDLSHPGDMEVSFIPFVWMKYRLIFMSDDYRFMLVGSSSMDLLWLMSRAYDPSPGEYEALTARAAALGYDASRLERVSQSGK